MDGYNNYWDSDSEGHNSNEESMEKRRVRMLQRRSFFIKRRRVRQAEEEDDRSSEKMDEEEKSTSSNDDEGGKQHEILLSLSDIDDGEDRDTSVQAIPVNGYTSEKRQVQMLQHRRFLSQRRIVHQAEEEDDRSSEKMDEEEKSTSSNEDEGEKQDEILLSLSDIDDDEGTDTSVQAMSHNRDSLFEGDGLEVREEDEFLEPIIEKSVIESRTFNYESAFLNECEVIDRLAVDRHYKNLERDQGFPAERKIRLKHIVNNEEEGFVSKPFKTFDDREGKNGPRLQGMSLNQHILCIDKNLKEEGEPSGPTKFEMNVIMNCDSFRFYHGSLLVHLRLLHGYCGKFATVRSRQQRMGNDRVMVRNGVGGMFPTIEGKKVKNIPLHRFPNILLVNNIHVRNMDLRIYFVYMNRQNLKTSYFTKGEHTVLNICLNVTRYHYEKFISDELNSGEYLSASEMDHFMQAFRGVMDMKKGGDEKLNYCSLPEGALHLYLLCFERVLKHFADVNLSESRSYMEDIEFEKPRYHGYSELEMSNEDFLTRENLGEVAHELYNNKMYCSTIVNVKHDHTLDKEVKKKKRFKVMYPFPEEKENLESFENEDGIEVIRYMDLTMKINSVFGCVWGDFMCNFDWKDTHQGKGIVDVGLDFWMEDRGLWLQASMEDLHWDVKQNYKSLVRPKEEYRRLLSQGDQSLIEDRLHEHANEMVDEDFIREFVNPSLDEIDESRIPSSLLSLMGEGKRDKFTKYGAFGSTIYGSATTGKLSCIVFRCEYNENVDEGLGDGLDGGNRFEEERILFPIGFKPLFDGEIMGMLVYSNKQKSAQMRSGIRSVEIYERLGTTVWKVLNGMIFDNHLTRDKARETVKKMVRRLVSALDHYKFEIQGKNMDVRLEVFRNSSSVQNFVGSLGDEVFMGDTKNVENRQMMDAKLKSNNWGEFTDVKYGEMLHIGYTCDLVGIDKLLERARRVLWKVFVDNFEEIDFSKMKGSMKTAIFAYFEYCEIILNVLSPQNSRIWRHIGKSVPFGWELDFPLACLDFGLTNSERQLTGLEFGVFENIFPLQVQLLEKGELSQFLLDDPINVRSDYMQEVSREDVGSYNYDWSVMHTALFGKSMYRDQALLLMGSVNCCNGCGEVLGVMRSLFRYYDVYGKLLHGLKECFVDDGNENCDDNFVQSDVKFVYCLLYTSPSPRDATLSRMPSSA